MLTILKMTFPWADGALFAKLGANRFLTQSLQINALRVFSIGIGFLGSIWSSRCLGPEKLGISGIIIGTITPLVLLINLNQVSHYVRLYRNYETETERADLVTAISTFKIVISVTIVLLAIPLFLFGNFPPGWHVALLAGVPYFLLTANAADWLLQCEDKLPAITMAVAVQSFITMTLYFVFFRPGMPAGADLVVMTLGLAGAFVIAWYTGLNGRKIRLFEWKKLRLMYSVLKEGRWLILTGFAVYAYTSIETPLVGWLYSLKELGIYRTSIALVSGVQAFTGYIPMLLYPRMIEWNRVGPLHFWEQQKKALTYLAIGAPCIAVPAFLLAPLGYHYIYGPPFQSGAYPFAILLSSKLMTVLSGILGWGIVAQKNEKALFKVMVCVAIGSITCNFLVIPHFGALGASSTNLLSEVAIFFLLLIITRRTLKTRLSLNHDTPGNV